MGLDTGSNTGIQGNDTIQDARLMVLSRDCKQEVSLAPKLLEHEDQQLT
jgi:hypothetical protein